MSKRKKPEPRRTDTWHGQPPTSDHPRPQQTNKYRSRYAPPPKINPVYQDPNTAGPPKHDPRYTNPRRINPVYQHPDDSSQKKPVRTGSHPNRVGPPQQGPGGQGGHRSGPKPPFQRPGGKPHQRPEKGEFRKHERPEKGEFRKHDRPAKSDFRKNDRPHKGEFRKPERRVEPPAPVEQAVTTPVPAPQPRVEGRGELPQGMIGGRNPVMEALRSETTPIEKIIFHAGATGDNMSKIRAQARQRGIVMTELRKQKFRDLTNDAMTQGVVAIVGIKEYVDVVDILAIAQQKNEKPCLLILDEIEDPHNLGALIRTAECAGVHGVVIPRHHAASVNQTVTKTSAGASEHMPVAKVANIAQTLDALKADGIWIVGTDDSAEQPYTKIDFTLPVAIVIGNEGKGMRQLVREKCDYLVKIPLLGKIGSLNASVAGALVMYEVVRKRKGL
jgi:23S rRNA (guanosine2251-2'-O)-methyltransferase